MKKIIIILAILVTIFLPKIEAQILTAGDAVVTFNDTVWYFGSGTPPKNLVMEVLRTGNTAAAAPNVGSIANPVLSWGSFMYYDARWTSANLGKIFGVTIDNNKNIFVTATGFFGTQIVGKSTGGVYKIDGITGTPSLVKDLNLGGLATDNALGNIKYFNGYLYISNLKDGKIYSINATTYATAATYSPTGWAATDKPCGLAIRNIGGTPKLYFSRNGFNAATTGIYSIDLLAAGLFGVTQTTEIPIASLTNNADPITDIAFSKTGNQIILAQKTNSNSVWNVPNASIGGYAHASTVIKYNYVGASWVNAAANFQIGYGIAPYRNCAGGLDFSEFQINKNKVIFCDTSIYTTADAITFGNALPPAPTFSLCYGVTGFNNQTGAGSNTGINIDVNNDLSGTSMYKGHYGDIEILDTTVACTLACQCSQNPKIYLTWASGANGALHSDTLKLACGETYTDKLKCFQPYIISVDSPCGANCQPDSIITTIQPPTGPLQVSYSLGGTTLIANQVGTYTVTIKVKCNGKWCPPCVIRFIQTQKCEPPCDNCKDKVSFEFDSGASSVSVQTHPLASTLNATFVLGGGADTYTNVRANIVDFQITSDNPACLQCYNTPNQWGSIISGGISGFTPTITSYPSVSPFNGNNNPREINFSTTTPTTIPMGTNLNLSIKVPGVNPLSCCCIKIVLYIKITYRNNKCEECTKIVRVGFTECPGGNADPATGNPNGGNATFDPDGGHPQFRMHAPNAEDAQKNNKASYIGHVTLLR
ncbi:MAG: hypothetical protein HOO89_04470 [Ferruginibacter sp.]|nr:hypothetical protein [Ferruginibacter sp.]